MTRRFFIESKKFIDEQIEAPEQQAELIGALHAYVRADTDQRVSPTEFAQRFMDAQTALSFRETLSAQGVTMDAFQKNDESLKRYLDRRTQRFPGRITLLAPDAAFDDGLVTISAEVSADGTEETVIRIRNAAAN